MNYELKDNILEIDVDSIFVDTIQAFFDEFIPSKKIQHLLIQNKWIKLDGNACKRESDIMGMKLSINIYPNKYEYKEVKNKIDVIYEDEFLLVVNKPKGILVHSDGNNELTLTDMVESYYKDKSYICPKPLHRLDKETCGLVVYSKSEIFQPLFDQYLSLKKIRRNYLAFVKGSLEENKTLTINKPIGKDRHNPNKRIIYDKGQPALTKIKSLGTRNNISILRCSLDTGRTHQIRLHLASVGLPILNDELYGVNSNELKRMGLIANELELYHPLKQEQLSIDCDLPKDMNELINKIL